MPEMPHAALLVMTLTAACAADPPSVVRVVQTDQGWQLQRNGEPYFIRGVGGDQHLDLLVEVGGNSIRTWGVGDNTQSILDRAHELGLTVTLGIWMEQRSQGGDYSQPELRARQIERVRQTVSRFRDHPALLIWGIGNESEVRNNTPEYWRHLNDLATLCKELDPNHPTMHVTAETGGEDGYGARLRELAPAIDIWGINSYGGMFTLRQRLARQRWTGPYLITEFGARGTWEMPKTAWGHPFEQTSTEKAAQFARLFREQIDNNPQVLGSYAFHWISRSNPSHTWFSLLRPDGRPTEIVDTLQRQWTGSWPDDLGPKVIAIDSEIAAAVVRPDTPMTATVRAFDPEGGPLRIEWMIRLDRHQRSWPADARMNDADMQQLIVHQSGDRVTFRTPPVEDAFRLLVFVTDESGKTATANVPFFVAVDGRPPQSQTTPATDESVAPTTRDDYVE